MASWITYKGIELPDVPTGDAGINLKDDLIAAADRAPYKATSNPTSGDDSADGFEVGSRWLNTSTSVMWTCIDPTASAAVWRTLYRRQASLLTLMPSDSAGQRGIQLGTGGNARGADAIDFQATRASATQVASGARSFIAGGENNTASGVDSFATGTGCIASGDYSHAEGISTTASGIASHAEGQGTVASGMYSHAEGYNTTASGDDGAHAEGQYTVASGLSSHAEGSYTTASGSYSHAGGLRSVASLYGQFARASGYFAADGDAQTSLFTLRCQTTDATQTEMFIDGSAIRLALSSDTTWNFNILISARRTDADNESAAWELKGCIDNNAGTTALVGTVISTTLGDDSGGAWGVTADADDTNDALRLRVTGQASKTIRWVARVTTSEVTG